MPANDSISERVADVGGVKLQYLTAGHGPAIVLLHGYAETSRMWKPLMPKLASNFTVIAPDLPGIGGSDVPRDGLDMTHSAIRIHDLVKQLGIAKAQLVGHDIGLMVAYAYAAQFPAETERLVLMDAFLPGVAGLAKQVQLVASNVTTITLPNTGHWMMEERPQETMAALVQFLDPHAAAGI
jgi:pimeloyl-ACP methyl ester carboxylesterase